MRGPESSEISRIETDGSKRLVRPSFKYHAPNTGTWESADATSELCESMRNILEDIRDSQLDAQVKR
jgi:hypothetical protein